MATFYGLGGVVKVEYGLGGAVDFEPSRDRTSTEPGNFSQDRTASPKEFLHEKSPNSETERLVCLAYYLTHYRGTPHFKALDIAQLNTEAAQIKFSNASAVSHKAQAQGLIGPAPDGQKQITARGERFVTLLPDRQAGRARSPEKRASRRRKRKPSSTKPVEGA